MTTPISVLRKDKNPFLWENASFKVRWQECLKGPSATQELKSQNLDLFVNSDATH